MHITSGKLKYKKISTTIKGQSKEIDYRPTSGRTRQAIINILKNAKYLPEGFIDDAVFADIYCGSGSFGFEALSHEAKHVVFVDLDNSHLNIARNNAKKLDVTDKCHFIRADATNLPMPIMKCKIIYLDPPYRSNMAYKTVQSIINSGWLEDRNLLIIELDKREDLPAIDHLEILDTRKYGKTKLVFATVKTNN